ncbi:type II toxin-antitoxin system VapC family toxin [Microbacterium sp.]|uniref:type II toxin-antitoxin system VapC family toxin n=1 Tax=Microbacterium sp. TaxID=51671 RepID=UPI0039E62DAC
MSAFLLDTHVWIWMLEDDKRMRGRVRAAVESEDNQLFLSIASLWEISIKMHRGRLQLAGTTEEYLRDRLRATRVETVPIDLSHAVAAGALPPHHGDPFDRMIVAQAQALDVPVLSVDAKLAAYDIDVIGR